MVSNPLFIIPAFYCIFPMNFATATLGLKKMGKFLMEGRETNLHSQRDFPISFKPKVAIAEFFWKMQRKAWYSILGLDAMSLSLKNLLLNSYVLAWGRLIPSWLV